MITRKFIRDAIIEYIQNPGLLPDNQAEERKMIPLAYFDIVAIVDEYYEWLLKLPKETDLTQLRVIIRRTMHMAEDHANRWRRFKVCDEDIAYACNKEFQTLVTI